MQDNYTQHYTENGLWDKIKETAKTAGSKVVYAVLLLFYAMKDKKASVKTKLTIAAALGYFILPTDAIFDLTPLIGYSDDLGVLLFALSQISSLISPEVKEKARNKLKEWFGEVDKTELQDLEDQIL